MFFTEISRGSNAIRWPGNPLSGSTFGDFRGLHLVVGWQWDRMKRELPKKASLTVVAVSLVWICTLFWQGRTGDSATAFTFGALICGSATLLVGIINS
jgi:hypothetical protein